MKKPVLHFYTNMPTPYQLDFIDALKDYFELTVIYFTARESDRQWTLATSGQGYQTILLENGPLARMVQQFRPSFHYAKGIGDIARKAKPDMVIVNGTYWSPNVVLSLRSAARHAKLVAFWSEPVFPVSNMLSKWLKSLLLYPVKKYTDCLFAIGQRAVDCYQWYGYTKPIHNIPYNIDHRLFAEGALDAGRLADLKRHYKPNDELIFLSSGSLIQRKGMDLLLAAFRELSKEFRATLLIIGDGSEKQSLESMAKGLDVNFLGFQEKTMVPYWFNLCDVFVFASRYDGWALVVNEAMAATKPVISSDAVGAAVDCIRSGKNGLVFPSGDVQELYRAMKKLAADQVAREAMAKEGYSTGCEISSSSMARKVYDIYQLDQQ